MTTGSGLRFGPVALWVEGPPLHPLLDPWRAPVTADARRVVVTVAATLPTGTNPATAAVGFALAAHADRDDVTLRGDPAQPTPWLAAFCEVVARDAATHGGMLLHAGAVTVAGGVALLLAPPGVGKTTAVRGAGGRAFASNAVLVDLTGRPRPPMVRAMPFTDEPAPELDSQETLPLAVLAFVERAEHPTVERLVGSQATIRLMSHVTRPRGADPHVRIRAALTLSLGGEVRAVKLGLPRGPGYIAALDTALHPKAILT